MRGRKPKPTAQRRLDGNAGKRAFNANEPQLPLPDSVFDTPPPELQNNPVAQAEWLYQAPKLRKARQISAADRSALLALCIEWSRYLAAIEGIERRGMIVQAPSGYPIPNPYLSIATRALQSCIKLWPELGLTPSSRSRVSMVNEGAEDQFSEFDEPPAAIN
jgi:P27 family predicted phage terminase small subunit